MKKLYLYVAAAFVSLSVLVPVAVKAGFTTTGTVIVAPGPNGFAEGVIGDARSSIDSKEAIACHIIASTSGVTGQCDAVDANNNFFACTTRDPGMIQAITSITPLSFLEFFGNPTCAVIEVRNSSAYRPATP